MRHASTQMCKSTTKLVSDHKWIVTGTPVNTSINDLKNQLKFLGIEMVEEMFTQFCGPFSRNRRETIDELEIMKRFGTLFHCHFTRQSTKLETMIW